MQGALAAGLPRLRLRRVPRFADLPTSSHFLFRSGDSGIDSTGPSASLWTNIRSGNHPVPGPRRIAERVQDRPIELIPRKSQDENVERTDMHGAAPHPHAAGDPLPPGVHVNGPYIAAALGFGCILRAG